MHIVIVTGLSGAGKSTALRALEDYGFFCIDNMPLPLAPGLVEWITTAGASEATVPPDGPPRSINRSSGTLGKEAGRSRDGGASGAPIEELALAVDARQHRCLASYREELDTLSQQGHKVDVLYLDASDECLVRRFSATRRRHPLSHDDLIEGIRRDRAILSELREIADVVDTEMLNVHQLKALIQDRYGHAEGRLSVVLLSFGFKHGLPKEANLVFDVRFLPNPYFEPELTEHDGRDPRVAEYVMGNDEAQGMIEHIERLLRFALPQFQKERKLYLTVAIGCTGGRHRSVALVEELHRRLRADWDAVVKHRDLDLRN